MRENKVTDFTFMVTARVGVIRKVSIISYNLKVEDMNFQEIIQIIIRNIGLNKRLFMVEWV